MSDCPDIASSGRGFEIELVVIMPISISVYLGNLKLLVYLKVLAQYTS